MGKTRYEIKEWDGTFDVVTYHMILGTQYCYMTYVDDGTTHKVTTAYFWSLVRSANRARMAH